MLKSISRNSVQSKSHSFRVWYHKKSLPAAALRPAFYHVYHPAGCAINMGTAQHEQTTLLTEQTLLILCPGVSIEEAEPYPLPLHNSRL